MYRAVIADDHPLVVASLAELFEVEQLLHVVASVSTGIDTITAVKSQSPDLLILDIDMPMGRGTEVFGECRRWSPDTRVIILSGASEPNLLLQLYLAGADAVLTKANDRQTIKRAIRTVIDGGRFLDPSLAEQIAEGGSPTHLTRRELQVLDLIANGLSNTKIGIRLGVSAKTIDGHRTNLMTKFGAHSVAELVVKAMRSGLL